MQLMDEHVEDFRFGRTLTNALRIVNAEQEAAFYRVNAALLADKAPKVVVPKSCKECMGAGWVVSVQRPGCVDSCIHCGGTGTRMPA